MIQPFKLPGGFARTLFIRALHLDQFRERELGAVVIGIPLGKVSDQDARLAGDLARPPTERATFFLGE
jgi:hypothetical protein